MTTIKRFINDRRERTDSAGAIELLQFDTREGGSAYGTIFATFCWRHQQHCCEAYRANSGGIENDKTKAVFARTYVLHACLWLKMNSSQF